MKKLLHERLRECKGTFSTLAMMGLDPDDDFSYEGLFQMMADEIERYYAPLPRDNKGMPYHVGETVYSVDPETEYSAKIIDINATGIIRIRWEDGGLTDYVDPADIQHERPQPKVLDADGVEINVGDTVYTLTSDIKMKVLMLDTNFDCEPIIQTEGGRYQPYHLSHKEPVLDADGVLIKVEDTVWDIKHPIHKKHTVIEVIPDDNCVICEDKLTYTPEYLTHKEPDSLEKLRDDISKIVAYGGVFDDRCTLKELQQFEDRLSALIERGA